MEILYISALSSKKKISEVYEKKRINPGYAVQKFSRLLVQGLISNGAVVTALTVPPISKSFDIRIKDEVEDDISYKYIPLIKVPGINHLVVFIYSFFFVLLWGMSHTKNKVIFCDVLCISICFASVLASKLVGLRSVAIVTDIYSQMAGQRKFGLKGYIVKITGKIANYYVSMFDYYVLLTKYMNDLVNRHNRPFVVMEALCDKSLTDENILNSSKGNTRIIMYAGGIEEKYGLKMLVEGFQLLQETDIELHLYGHGSYVEEIKTMIKNNHRIKYYGIVPNEEIIIAELEATLLVNPRFSSESLAKYSFPSKNMEYMASGTPLLTTRLPCMPSEYYPYLYFIDEESIDGCANAIKEVLGNTEFELKRKGMQARKFVLHNKNNKVQTAKILDLINEI